MSEKSATDYVMEKVHEYGISCVNLHIRSREGFAGVDDERKHQQALFSEIAAMIDQEVNMLMDACSELGERLNIKK